MSQLRKHKIFLRITKRGVVLFYSSYILKRSHLNSRPASIIVAMDTPSFHVILYKPEIPYNTGNIIRLCANVGAELHLIRPLGFEMTEARLKRAALDYTDLTIVTEHESLESYVGNFPNRRLFAATAKAKLSYADIDFQEDDSFLFGSESSGLPDDLLGTFEEERKLLVPMRPNNRCLNIANSVSIIAYEAWRQLDFSGRADPR